jgi:threonine/homoserine/homoserine lactone efflux protein
MIVIIIKSILAGFFLAIPFGPLGAMALRKMLTKGALHGIYFGFGFALVDFIYAIIVGFGIHSVSNFIEQHQDILYFTGIIFFTIMGIKIFFTTPISADVKAVEPKSYLDSTKTAFFLGLTSPATFFSFTVVFAGLNLTSTIQNTYLGIFIVLCIVVGGLLWWFSFSIIVYYVNKRIQPGSLDHINHIFGITILMFIMIVTFMKIVL